LRSANDVPARAAHQVPLPPARAVANQVSPRPGVGLKHWSLSFVGVLAYIFAAVTFRLPIVGPSIVAALFGLVFERRRVVLPAFLVLFGFFVAWSGIGYGYSIDPGVTWEALDTLAKILVIAFVIVNVTRDSWRLRSFTIFFLACFAAFPARGTLFNYFVGGYTEYGRAVWNFIYRNSNDLAGLTFFPLSLSISTAMTETRRWIKVTAQIGVAVLTLIILLTQSRGALIALVLCAVCFFIMNTKGKRLRTLFTGFAVVIVILPFVPESAWRRFSGLRSLTSTTTVAQADPEGSAEGRYNIWRVASAIIAANPMTGVGIGTYRIAHASYAGEVGVPQSALGPKDTHSTYLNVAAETGIPGLILFVAMIGAAWIKADRVRRRAKETLRGTQLMVAEIGLLGFLAAGVFGSYSRYSFLYIQLSYIWLLADLTEKEVGVLPAAREAPRRSNARLRRA
jgi:probable O-glycosylation ligase (exosortase A-associated)